MYSPSTPFNDYLQGEQTKYPELTLDAIETLKMSLKEDRDLPPITGQWSLSFVQFLSFNTFHTFVISHVMNNVIVM